MADGATGCHSPLTSCRCASASAGAPATAHTPRRSNAPAHDSESVHVHPVRDTACFMALVRFLPSNSAPCSRRSRSSVVETKCSESAPALTGPAAHINPVSDDIGSGYGPVTTLLRSSRPSRFSIATASEA